MKVLFIVPPESQSIESYASKKIIQGREFRPNLGLLCVAGYLRYKTQISPVIIDCLAEGISYDRIGEIIKKYNPDIVGMSVLTFNLLDCLKTAEIIKQIKKEIKICFGGFHPTLYPEETCRLDNVDFVVMGEGEETFSELVSKLTKDEDCKKFDEIDGLVWVNSDGNVVLNKCRKPIDNLSELPMPAHDLIDISKYTHVLSNESKTAYIQTSRGCPFGCLFCDMRRTTFRSRNEDSVIAEIKYLYAQGIKEIFFLDDTITVNKKRLIKLCQRIIDEKIKIKYKISSRVNTVDEEILHYLKKSGCVRIHYGVESGSQRILDYLEKGITIEQIAKAFEISNQAGIATYAYLMIGVPTETKDDFEATLALVKRIKPDYVTYSICTPFPKTKLFQNLLEHGHFGHDYWQEFAEKPTYDFKLRYANEHFSEKELREMQDNAMAQFYSSGSFLLKELFRIRSLKQLMVKIKVGYKLLLD